MDNGRWAMPLIAALAACSGRATDQPVDLAAQQDSLRSWAAGVEAAFDRFEGCHGGDAARAFYANDGVLMTTDSATMTFDGQAWTALFTAAACARKESAFRLDSIIVRSLGPGVGVVAATYIETATDTANTATRLRGSVQWVVQQGPQGWKSPVVSMTEHRTALP